MQIDRTAASSPKSDQRSTKVQIVSKLASKELSLKYSDLSNNSSVSSDDLVMQAPLCFQFAIFQCYSPQAAVWLRDLERRRDLDSAPPKFHALKPTDSSSRLAKLIAKKRSKKKWFWNLYSRASIKDKVPEYISCRAFGCISQDCAVPPVHLPKRHVPEVL